VSCNNIYLVASREQRTHRTSDPGAALLSFVIWHGFALLVSWMFFLALSVEWKIAIVSIWAAYTWLLYSLFAAVFAQRRRHFGGTK
jgi:hypothetical protein